MIHVIAALKTVAGRRDELIAAMKELTPKVHAEQGCVEYGAAVDLETPLDSQEPLRDDVVMVVEKWESLDALQKHLEAPHMEEFRSAMSGVISNISLQVLSPA